METSISTRSQIMPNLFCDVDETIRAIANSVYDKYPTKYGENVEGMSFVDYVNNNIHVCEESEPTEYLPIINMLQHIKILSAQPNRWRSHTSNWLNKYMRIPYHSIFVDKCEEKLQYMKHRDFIIDDSPEFEDYSQVILITRPYNMHIETKNRVHTPNELFQKLLELGFVDIIKRI